MGYTRYGIGKEDSLMPWKETCVMDLKMQMIGACLSDEHTVADIARAYGVSRKTVYKWLARYASDGASGLEDAPRHVPHAIDEAVAQDIIATKRAHPSFGPKKVMDRLRAQDPDRTWPADSTAGELLKRVGLVNKRRYKQPYPADPQPFELGHTNHVLWSVDYKGQYPSAGADQWCYPLTITDNASRYLIGCQGVCNTRHEQARPVFEWAFRTYGLPQGILSDNGPPFASHAAGGLTELSLWWIRQGIKVHRTKPGTPTQNARHERMHGTLNRAIGAQMRGAGRVRQDELLSHFRHEYNHERSHESLDRQTPASRFVESTRPLQRHPAAHSIPRRPAGAFRATQRRDQVQRQDDLHRPATGHVARGLARNRQRPFRGSHLRALTRPPRLEQRVSGKGHTVAPS
jgi:transposase InsO family protein